MSPEPKITRGNFGAWLLKCNPAIYDLPSALEAGEDVESWSVADNYRTHMMVAGDPVALWMTGPKGAVPTPGLWGVGHVTGPPYKTVGFTDDEDEVHFWIDEEYGIQVRDYVPVAMTILDVPIPRSVFTEHPVLGDLEILKQPQMSNPSHVTPHQLSALIGLVGGWPEYEGDEPEVITVSDAGAGFGDPDTNAVVEMLAMTEVDDWYSAMSWTVEDVSKSNCGWDLTCKSPDGRTVDKVEVKGISGSQMRFLLTKNEYSKAQTESGWKLAAVTRALSQDAKLSFLEASAVVAKAKPYVFEYRD